MIHKQQMPGGSPRHSQRGSAMIEASFIFVVFFFLLIGIFDFGQFLFVHQALVQRARSSARAGVVKDYTTGQIRNLVLYDSTSGSGAGYFGLTSAMVVVSSLDFNTDDSRVEVKVINYPYQILSPYIGGTYTGPNITIDVPRGIYN